MQTFLKSISPKINVRARLMFELASQSNALTTTQRRLSRIMIDNDLYELKLLEGTQPGRLRL